MNNLNVDRYSNADLIQLWAFNNHVIRLDSFSKPLYKKIKVAITIPTKAKNKKKKTVLTELRLSALLNELRPFMLNKDPIYFYKILNIIAKNNNNNPNILAKIDSYRNMWKEYDININNKTSKRTFAEYNINTVRINTYSKLLNIFMYGKYIHNDNITLTSIAKRLEDGYFYEYVKMELTICMAEICNILRRFNTEFSKPIIKKNEGIIKYLTSQSILVKSPAENRNMIE